MRLTVSRTVAGEALIYRNGLGVIGVIRREWDNQWRIRACTTRHQGTEPLNSFDTLREATRWVEHIVADEETFLGMLPANYNADLVDTLMRDLRNWSLVRQLIPEA